MNKKIWELDDHEREALAEQRCNFLFTHVTESGGAPLRTSSPTTILVPAKGEVLSVEFSKKEPRHVTVALSFAGQPMDERRAVYAAQSASQSTIVAKVRIEPREDEFRYSVQAEFFNDDESDLSRVFGLYLAAVLDTHEAFVAELVR